MVYHCRAKLLDAGPRLPGTGHAREQARGARPCSTATPSRSIAPGPLAVEYLSKPRARNPELKLFPPHADGCSALVMISRTGCRGAVYDCSCTAGMPGWYGIGSLTRVRRWGSPCCFRRPRLLPVGASTAHWAIPQMYRTTEQPGDSHWGTD